MVAGEPVETQVRVDDMGPWVNPKCVMLGDAGKRTYPLLKFYSMTTVFTKYKNALLTILLSISHYLVTD